MFTLSACAPSLPLCVCSLSILCGPSPRLCYVRMLQLCMYAMLVCWFASVLSLSCVLASLHAFSWVAVSVYEFMKNSECGFWVIHLPSYSISNGFFVSVCACVWVSETYICSNFCCLCPHRIRTEIQAQIHWQWNAWVALTMSGCLHRVSRVRDDLWAIARVIILSIYRPWALTLSSYPSQDTYEPILPGALTRTNLDTETWYPNTQIFGNSLTETLARSAVSLRQK